MYYIESSCRKFNKFTKNIGTFNLKLGLLRDRSGPINGYVKLTSVNFILVYNRVERTERAERVEINLFYFNQVCSPNY